MNTFKNSDGKSILLKMVDVIQKNKDYLSELDGLIGDGDHGINMNKGFTIFKDRFAEKDISFSEGLNELGMVLFNEIGGSMGPIYGTVFIEMAERANSTKEIDLKLLSSMLDAALEGLFSVVDARVGDKTLVDVLSPACNSLHQSLDKGENLPQAMDNMKQAALKGRDSTKDMIAKYGRSSRLGQRSRGVLDTGATSCNLIIGAIADGIKEIILYD